MTRKERVREHVEAIANEVLGQIKENEGQFLDRWVPAAEVTNYLGLYYVAVPQANKQHGLKGWLFAIVARLLEDQGRLQYTKRGSRAYYRSV